MTTLILMATYNGARFLSEQLESLISQTEPDWRLLVRDDGSSDKTLDILAQASSRDPRIELLLEGGGRKGSAGNFTELLGAAAAHRAEYFALCDQDDVWQPDKLTMELAALYTLESEFGRNCPLVVHSDLEVTDESMRTRHSSLMDFQLIRHPADMHPLTLVAQNHAVGCTMLFNRALLELAWPSPGNVHMHDWWLALCAEFAGARHYLPRPLVRYRQHGSNVVGAQGVMGRLARPWAIPSWLRKIWRIQGLTWDQAEALLYRLEETVGRFDAHPGSGEKLADLRRFVESRNLGGVSRAARLWRLGLRCQNPAMTSLYYLHALLSGAPGPNRAAG